MTTASGVEIDAPEPARGVISGDGNGDALKRLCYADLVFSARYEGWEELGRGACATVVRTHLKDAGVAVALKVWWRLSEGDSRQLRAEAQALMRIVHPSVVRTFAVFDRGALGWLELELIEGRTLRDALRARGADWAADEALEIGACLAEGLAAVHAAGFIHRDVKPSNVLLPRDGRPAAKLSDFGLARAVDATVLLGEAVPGSMKYVSPEALSGHTPGTAGDVYALAVTLYELLSGGRYPFALSEGAAVAEVLDCHRRRAPIPLRALGLGWPDALVDVIQRGLAKNPRRRPNAAQIAQALRAAQPGATPEIPVTATRGVWTGRRAAATLLACAGLGLLVAVGCFVAWRVWHG